MSEGTWKLVDGSYSGEFTDVMTVPDGMIVRSGHALSMNGAMVSLVFVPGKKREIATWIQEREAECQAKKDAG